MKRILLLLITAFITGYAYSQKFNDAEHLVKDTVVICEGLTKAEIYSNVMQTLNNIKGANAKSTSNLDFCDKDAGIINYKGKIYLGYAKKNMFYGFDVYADAMFNVRVKDGKVKITIDIASYTLHWTADNSSDNVVPIFACYPTYDKTKYKVDLVGMPKTCLMAAEVLPKQMDFYLNALAIGCNRIEDDF